MHEARPRSIGTGTPRSRAKHTGAAVGPKRYADRYWTAAVRMTLVL